MSKCQNVKMSKRRNVKMSKRRNVEMSKCQPSTNYRQITDKLPTKRRQYMNYNKSYYINKGRLLNHNINIDKQTVFSIFDKTLEEFINAD